MQSSLHSPPRLPAATGVDSRPIRAVAFRAVAVIGLVATLAQAAAAGEADGRLDIYWIDVEGGAATLIVTPEGQSVLVDAGNPGIRDPQRIARVASRVAGVRTIDFLIITHYHRDHYGGATTLSQLMPIGSLYDNGLFEGMPDNPGGAYFALDCRERFVIEPGDLLPLDGEEVRLTCLAARRRFIDPPEDTRRSSPRCPGHPERDRDGSDNANSVVLLLELGPFRFLDAGDLTWNQEHRLVCPVNLVGPVDVYQVTHHGKDSSNHPFLLQSVSPTVAVMNNGATKGCDPEVVENLRDTESLEAVYQLHKNLRPEGAHWNARDEYIANREADCEANYIHLSVEPEGDRYTVAIPGTGHRRTFETTRKP